MTLLPHAERVERLLREGKRAEAREAQKGRVAAQMQLAREGHTISLSDLIGGAEALHIAAIEDRARDERLKDDDAA